MTSVEGDPRNESDANPADDPDRADDELLELTDEADGDDATPAAPTDDEPDDDEDPPRVDDAESLERLRGLLLGDQAQRLARVETALRDQRLSPQDVSNVLPAAFRLRPADDPQLDNALAPTLESAVHDSVRRNPQAMADAIFPILGPAIRKAISAALAGMVQSFNTALEHAVSPRGIRWRLEAMRTGRSFGEVVLMHSLLYRTEQVLLVHRETSTLLCHAHAATVAPGDPDLISAMLSAIQDFVGDSFADGERQVLKVARFEDFSLHVTVGPQLVLAALVRGEAPAEFQAQLERTLEQAHLDSSRALEEFDGDVTPFEPLTGLLEGCLREQQREQPANKLLIGAWVVGLVAVLAWFTVGVVERRGTVARWREALIQVDAEPGLVVLSREFADDKLLLRCLADPEATPPRDVLTAAGLAENEFALTTTPWNCLDPSFVRRRIQRALDPPSAAWAVLDERGRLELGGHADHAWITRALAMAPTLPGVTSVDASGLFDEDVIAFHGGVSQLEQTVLYFDRQQIGPDLDDALRGRIVGAVTQLIEGARALGRPVRIDVLGWSETGETRTDLGLLRAERTIAALADELPDDLWIEPRDGARASVGLPGLGESDVAGNTLRRVRFHVVMLAPAPEDQGP